MAYSAVNPAQPPFTQRFQTQPRSPPTVPDAPLLTLTIQDTLTQANPLIAYILLFTLAAIPFIEILLVIPPAITLGMDPLLVTIIAFTGNTLTLLLAITLKTHLTQRWANTPPNKRWQRAQQLWTKHGLGALAIASPLATGTHLAALIALLLGSTRQHVTAWMIASLAAWSITLTLLTLTGLHTLT